MNSRRQFLIRAPFGFLAASAACSHDVKSPASQSSPATPGAPPTFAMGTAAGPAVSASTFAEAEKLAQVTMTAEERQQAADSWRKSIAPYLERRTGPRKVDIAPADAPATLWNPMLQGVAAGHRRDRFVRSKRTPLPASDEASPSRP